MLKSFVLISLVLHFVASINGCIPKMYRMDNYTECRPPKRYCVYDFKPHTNSTTSLLLFDRSTLNRMYCVPTFDSAAIYGHRRITEELGSNWSGHVEFECETSQDFRYFNTLLLLVGLVYVVVTVQATRGHWSNAFSLRQNIPKLWTDNLNPDFQRLKSIQGIRVFNTALVVFWHSLLSLCRCYVNEVEELEKNFSYQPVRFLLFLGGFSVQTFFLISTFLLTNQVYELRAKYGRLSLRHCAIMVLNRWCRFLPTILLALSLTTTGLYDGSPHTIKTRNLCLSNCQNYWWYTPMQISFLLDFNKICTPGLWYLSVDTLYYVLALVVLFVVLQFDLDAFKVFVSLVLGSIVAFGAYLYWYELKFMYQPYLEDFKYMIESRDMNLVYSPPIASWTSSLLGVVFGYWYYHHKDLPCVISQKWQLLGWTFFAIIPLGMVHLSMSSIEGFMGVVIGALIKPLFVLPLGMGLLGFALDYGGFLKRFLEAKWLLTASNVTYCTYLYHFFVVFAKGLFTKDLLEYRTNHMCFWVLFDIAASFTLGALATVLVEYPGLSLQKKLLPQIQPLHNKKA